MRVLGLLASVSALCAAAGACATSEDMRTLRRPVLPETHVALADHRSPLYRNVAVYEVLDVPEVRWFDGAAVYTTRPTRRDVTRSVNQWLHHADMLAPTIGEADYLLTLRFEDLHGPDVIWFTDKYARATVHYTLTCQRPHRVRQRINYGQQQSECTAPGQKIFEGAYEAQLQMRMPGVTPDMVRAGIASGVLSAMLAPEIRDSGEMVASAIGLGAILGDASARGVGNDAFNHNLDDVLDMLALSWEPLEEIPGFDVLESFGVFGAGLIVGADRGQNNPPYDTDRLRAAWGGAYIASGIAVGDENDFFRGDPQTRWLGGAGGALIGMNGAAPVGRPVEEWDAPNAIGAFDGTLRRHQAVRGMLRQNFNRFLFGLQSVDLLRIREAVPCADLNPNGYGPAVFSATADLVGYDCPLPRQAVRRTVNRPPPIVD